MLSLYFPALFHKRQIRDCSTHLAVVVSLLCLTAPAVRAGGAGVAVTPSRDGVSAAAHDLNEATSLLDGLGADSGAAVSVPNTMAIPAAHALTGPSLRKSLRESWSMVGGSADRTGAIAGGIAVSRLALLWQFRGRTPSAPLWGPVVAGGGAFFAEGREVYALDTASGKLNWKWLLPHTAGEANVPSVGAALVCAGARLFIGGTDSQLYILDAASGLPLQQLQLDAAVSSAPAVTEEALYLATRSGTVYAFSLPAAIRSNIQLLWARRPAPGETIGAPVALAGNFVYAATNSGKVFGLQRDTGAVFAKTDLGSVGGVQGIAATPSSVMVASGRSLYGLSPVDLGAQWARSYPAPIAGAPAFAGGSAYVITTAGVLYSTPLGNSSNVDWSVDLGTPSVTQPGLIMAGSVVMAASRGQVYGFGAGGDGAGRRQLLWQYSPPADAEFTAAHPWQAPEIMAQAIAGGDVYLLDRTGALACLSTNATDKAGPTVDLRYPEGGRYAPQDISGIVARVQDRESGYLKGSLKLMVDGDPIPAGYVFETDTGRLTYTPPRPFSAGVHTVRVLAADNRNNWSDTHWSFVVDPAASVSTVNTPAAAATQMAGAHSSSGEMEGAGMSLPRGIVPPGGSDFAPNYVRELRPLTRWTLFPLAVYFVRNGDYTPDRQRAATAGFNRWVQATGSAISYRLVSDPTIANVTVRFDPTKCDGITYTEIVASRIEKADISLGVAFPGRDSECMPLLDLACVAAHEFGHALGINGHSSDPSDIMYFQHTVGQPWTLTRRDLNTLRADYARLFGAASLTAARPPGL